MATTGKDLVFVTYAHEDEKWKNLLLPQFKQLERLGELSVWDDRQIKAGEDWYARIQDVLGRTQCAVCLISANFLNSAFCMDEEIPYLLQKRRKGGIEIVPILIEDCVWKAHRWLKRLQMFPRDGKTVADDFADRPARIFADAARQVWDSLQPGYVYHRPPPADPEPEKVDIDRLPESDALLFGRRKELKDLDDAWRERKRNVVVFRASGGVGKSTLVRCWAEELAEDNFLGAERVFAWSFYSQGTGDSEGRQGRATSADEFIGEALDFFGDPTRGEGLSAWDRGQRLAEKIREKRTLLLLDGMEPLQSSHAVVQPGEITDPGLATLVQELARENPGLCIISTREWVADLNDEEFGERVAQIELDTVSPLAGRALLRERGVRGDDEQLEATVKAFGGHAFALQLLGRYLDFYGGSEIGAAGDIPAGDDLPGVSRHPRRVMAAFATKFGEASAEVQLLRVLGLFDRPAKAGAIEALRSEPAITGLTDRLVGLEQSAWMDLLDRLRASGLLAPESHHALDEIDTHPLVREHFGAELRELHVDAWREGHSRLYEYLKTAAKEYPDTLAEMAPLFQAVFHGCQADRHQEAFDAVWWERITRGQEFYVARKLGAFGADLAALAGLFAPPFAQPVASITDADKAFILNQAGSYLRALGRVREALTPMEAGLQPSLERGDWKGAATSASNLSELHLTLGEVAKAVARAEESVAHADQSGDAFERMVNRTTHAAAQHQAGERERALALFEEAEALQAEERPHEPRLYAPRGFLYCDLLLDLGRQQEVRERAAYALEIAEQAKQLLGIALDHLSLGRAELVAWLADQSGDLAVAEEELNQAVDGLRQAGTMYEVPRGLLARAALFRVTGDVKLARRDLEEALRIAKRSEMRLHECDAHLEAARLHLAHSNPTTARTELDQAKALIATTGYHRRDRDAAEIEAALS